MLHLVEQVFRVLVQAGDGGLGFFQEPLLPVGLPFRIFPQQLCLDIQDVRGDEGIEEELEHHPVQPSGIYGQCGTMVWSVGDPLRVSLND